MFHVFVTFNLGLFRNFFFLLPSRLQVQYSWLWKLANVTQSPYSYVWMNDTNTPEIINGPSKKTMYVTALYFTMTCMTVSNPFHLNPLARVYSHTKNEEFFVLLRTQPTTVSIHIPLIITLLYLFLFFYPSLFIYWPFAHRITTK